MEPDVWVAPHDGGNDRRVDTNDGLIRIVVVHHLPKVGARVRSPHKAQRATRLFLTGHCTARQRRHPNHAFSLGLVKPTGQDKESTP